MMLLTGKHFTSSTTLVCII